MTEEQFEWLKAELERARQERDEWKRLFWLERNRLYRLSMRLPNNTLMKFIDIETKHASGQTEQKCQGRQKEVS